MSEQPIEPPTVSVREARERFADVVDRAERDEPTVITRRGREVAAVVPIELLREYRQWEERELLRLVAERRGEPTFSLEDVMAETLARPE
ncbi:type II toxin-antitoxin system prevent-host-death family antitoxin [Kitasatospora sp. NBC_00374]|uniref:type II toxin-antitoxin system Phd/YefM family antitoxin n=1 Tax=Kitasatospora sp. NBC_00374 TaxID=2975964 RepID=UPI0030E4A731